MRSEFKLLEKHSEALPVHDCWARLIILTLRDPHLLEGTQRRQDRATDPHRVLALRRSHDLDLHRGWCQGCKFFGHALTDTCKHCGSTRQHNVAVEVLADVHIAFHDGLEGSVMNAAGLLADEAWLEKHLRAAEALASHCDNIPIWQLIGLLLVRTLRGGLHLGVKVECDVAKLLLDITHDLTLSSCCKRVATLSENLHEVLSKITSCEIKTQDGMGQGVALVDGHGVGDAISRIHDNA